MWAFWSRRLHAGLAMRIVIRQLARVQCYTAWKTSQLSSDIELFSMRKGHARLRVGSQCVNFAYATPKEFRELLEQQETYPLPLVKIG
jgi:hypothetical protein